MSQHQKSVKIPTEFLEATKAFHQERQLYVEAMELLEKNYEESVKKVKAAFAEAATRLTQILVQAKVVTEDDTYRVNTEFLEDCGDAFVTIVDKQPAAAPAPEKQTVH